MQVYYEKNFGDIQKVRSLKIPEFDLLPPPPPPIRPTLVRFRAPPSPLDLATFWKVAHSVSQIQYWEKLPE